MNTTTKGATLNSFGIWNAKSRAPSPLSDEDADMPNQVLSTSSLIRMKLLIWFAEYTLISRRRTPMYERFGSVRYRTVWRLGKRREYKRR